MNTLLRFIGCVLIILAINTQNVLAQVKFTNQTADMRKGPAAYHEFLLRLYINNQVQLDSSQGYWDRIRHQQAVGWVPSYTLSDAKTDANNLKSDSLQNRMSLLFSQLNNEDPAEDTNLTASPAQVSAAVKGFAQKWRTNNNITYNIDLDRYQIEPATPSEFKDFITTRTRNIPRLQKRKLLYPKAVFIPFTDPAIDQVGYAVATAVAQKGLISNYEFQRYLDLLSGLIVENSHKPDLDFSIYILDVDEVEGYSLPGNYIFISKGALKQMQSEAELVHFISHEIAHLVFSHGMVEYKEREHRIKMESALDEMRSKLNPEQNANQELREMEQRITDWTNEVYDYINKERLEEYEFEADYWGIIYTWLSGYDAGEAIKYLNRIQVSDSQGRMEWTGVALHRRIDAVKKQLNQLNLHTGNTNSPEFRHLIHTIN